MLAPSLGHYAKTMALLYTWIVRTKGTEANTVARHPVTANNYAKNFEKSEEHT